MLLTVFFLSTFCSPVVESSSLVSTNQSNALHNENQKCTYTIQQHYFFISFTFIFYCSPCKLHHIHMNFTFIQLYIYMQICMDGRDTKSQEMASLFRIVHGCVIFVTGITSTYPKITHPRSMLKPLQLHIIYVLL